MEESNGVKVNGRFRGIRERDHPDSWLPSILIRPVLIGVLEDGVDIFEKGTTKDAARINIQ